MFERPPSLSKYNNQPFKVMIWGKECAGIHPKVFSFFHGDYDGDEVQTYALGAAKSILEASLWVYPLDQKLESALRHVEENCKDIYTWDGTEEGKKDTSYRRPDWQRLHVHKMFKERIHDKAGTKPFLRGSVQGVKDIMRQQVSQDKIGDMSRIARISAMCLLRSENGGTYAVCRKSKTLINRVTVCEMCNVSVPGFPAGSVRCTPGWIKRGHGFGCDIRLAERKARRGSQKQMIYALCIR
ncbi:hypothetical protein BJ878DRAFT_189172 [Calycina marina]|uniref:Uncharacterized protein n=1 Tax=Calycina marina TaxID=1763456 RepID=A0A9P7YY58_9HELO|nr:hypothetical protein BJ878DRAFT_189172 [Calycina marina]